jgi:hypothetical protein
MKDKLYSEDSAMLDPKSLNPQHVTDEAGEQTAAILPIGTFRALLEDIEDLAAIAERRERADHLP